MEIKMETLDALISVDVQHYGDRCKGVAAGAYVGHLSAESSSTYFWGYGGVRNVETLFAYAISHGLNELMAVLAKEEFKAQVFVLSDGFVHNLNRLMPRWMANKGLTSTGKIPDAYEVLKYCYLQMQLGRVCIDRVTPTRGGPAIERVSKEVPRFARFAFDQGGNRQMGIIRSSNDLNEIS